MINTARLRNEIQFRKTRISISKHKSINSSKSQIPNLEFFPNYKIKNDKVNLDSLLPKVKKTKKIRNKKF